MAYVDFSDDLTLAPQPVAPRADPLPRDEGRLTALEWQVVALARKDRLPSLANPGRLSVALGTLFGGRRPNPGLADPRLEALRRMAVLTWHNGYELPEGELTAFLTAGFTVRQYETLAISIVGARIGTGPVLESRA